MSDFKCDIVTPDALLASEDVEMVVVPGVEGEMGFLKGHATLMSVLADGAVRLTDPDGNRKQYALQGGYVEVTSEKVIVLADRALASDDIDASAAEEELKEIEEQLSNLTNLEEDDAKRKELETEKAWAEARIRATKDTAVESSNN